MRGKNTTIILMRYNFSFQILVVSIEIPAFVKNINVKLLNTRGLLIFMRL